jgi:large subunit ribosomal protein L13
VKVHIENASKAKVTLKKGVQTTYVRYTGFPGGIRTQTLDQMREKKGLSAALKITVRGMLPKNKLRDLMMKNLTIAE